MNTRAGQPGEFTGRHMLYLLLTFFGTIIAVNILLAVLAERTWTGLVVENSYVASQEFNRRIAEAREQAALGWHGALSIGKDTVGYGIASADGTPVKLDRVTVHFRHPAYDTADFTLRLDRQAGDRFSAGHAIPDGAWIVEVDADAGRARPFRDVRRILVRDGQTR